jgi:hypothetical protein
MQLTTSEVFTIPANGGKNISMIMSRPITSDDIARVRAWLDTYEDVLTDDGKENDDERNSTEPE